MSKPKVVFIHHFSELGGAEQFLVSLWENRRAAYDAILVNQSEGALAVSARAAGVRHVALSLPGWRKWNAWFSRKLAVARIVKLARREKGDVICSGCYRVTPYAVAAAKILGIPCVTILQDFIDEVKQRKFHVLQCDRLVAVSQQLAARVSPGYPRKIEVIHNGIDFRRVSACHADVTAFRDEWGIPAEALVVGMIAHILPWKGHKIFLDAMTRVHAQRPDVFFVIVGESLYQHELNMDALKVEAQRLGIAHRVVFTGGRDDVFLILRAVDILVHPSEKEAFGRVIIEAMAMGVSVVATRCGGPQEIIEHGETGLLVDVGDAEAMARETSRLLEDAALRKALGERGRQHVEQDFDSARLTEPFNRMIGELAGREMRRTRS